MIALNTEHAAFTIKLWPSYWCWWYWLYEAGLLSVQVGPLVIELAL